MFTTEEIYLKMGVSEKLREYRKIIRDAISPSVLLSPKSSYEFLSVRGLNMWILDYSAGRILGNDGYFNSFIGYMNTRDTGELIKEYFLISEILSSRVNELSKKYRREIKSLLKIPKIPKIFNSCLSVLFEKESVINFVIYYGIFLYLVKKEVISGEPLDIIMGELNSWNSEHKMLESDFKKILSEAFSKMRLVRESYNFALEVIEKSDDFSEHARDLLKEVRNGMINHKLKLAQEYLDIFRLIKLPSEIEEYDEYNKSLIISGIISTAFDAIETTSYIRSPNSSPFSIFSSSINALKVSQTVKFANMLKQEGLETTEDNEFSKDPEVSQILYSLYGLIKYSYLRDEREVINIIPMNLEEQESHEEE
ncbi:MAG: hypothetical protein QW292_14605 [Candidatus Parvarchaeota archaeon]